MVVRGVELYASGWFPMADEDGEVQWVQPHHRAMVPLDDRFHISRSLNKTLRKAPFLVSTDLAFSQVIRSCAGVPRAEGGTWLVDEIIDLFDLFHRGRLAHSVEVWRASDDGQPAELVGGVYGLAIGRVFCAESMFCLPARGGTDASKVALVALRHLVRSLKFSVLDAQIINPHTVQFGTYEIERAEYLASLDRESHAAADPWPDAGLLHGPLGTK
ncbi:MAG: leucyl/phenylalanyl-tRNA--protein transferase [Planctomycetota bacterium]|nr:leucyl/phenylalanyl-tRNA--protein transferase [Planctomycetota bacterium]